MESSSHWWTQWGKEQSDLRVTGRGITRLIICHLSFPRECDLPESRDLYFLSQCSIHLQQCLALKPVLLLLLLFLTSCSGIHSALLLYKTVQYLGFSYFITGRAQSHVGIYAAFSFRQFFFLLDLVDWLFHQNTANECNSVHIYLLILQPDFLLLFRTASF